MYISIFDTYFTTYTCYNWHNILEEDACKNIILDSFRYLTNEKNVRIYAFVIMPNHFHVIWFVPEQSMAYVKREFTKFTGKNIVAYLKNQNNHMLQNMISTQSDRTYQCWERRPFWKNVTFEKMLFQKLRYVHNNPLQKKWQLCSKPEDYAFSSASSYVSLELQFEFLQICGN